MLWATDVVPQGMEIISRAFGIRPALPALLTPEEAADFARVGIAEFSATEDAAHVV